MLHKLLPSSIYLKPSELKFDSHAKQVFYLHANTKSKVFVDQFIIELHQDELMHLPMEIIACLVNTCTILNDLRTIFLVHNKRFLSLLSDASFLADYLSVDHRRLLKSHIIPSHLPEKLVNDAQLYNKVTHERDQWLIKPCLFGKGEGIVFGKNVNPQDWIKIIQNCMANSKDFVIQEYVNQEKFTILHEEKQQEFKVAGCLMCFDTKFLGPGLLRSSTKDLVALSQGGFILFPVEGHCSPQNRQENLSFLNQHPELTLSRSSFSSIKSDSTSEILLGNFKQLQIPSDAKFKVANFSFKETSAYETALLKYGLVLLELNFEDPNSEFFSYLVNQLGTPIAHSSKNDDFLWHIRPSSVNKNLARSHNANVFEMHTDASFETNPPRYIAMQVIEHDQLNGGYSLFASVDDLIGQLSKSEIDLLSTSIFHFKKPAEFDKTGDLFTRGRILSAEKDLKFHNVLCRYRGDLILNRDQMSSDVKRVLSKFESLIDTDKSSMIKYTFLKKNSIILIDNARYLHGRTKIYDTNRHLVRMRFQTKYDELKFI